MPRNYAIGCTREFMHNNCQPFRGCTIYNRIDQRENGKHHGMNLDELVDTITKFPELVTPIVTNGSINYAFAVVGDLIFDSTQTNALRLSNDTVDWICGAGSVLDMFEVYVFNTKYNPKQSLKKKSQEIGIKDL